MVWLLVACSGNGSGESGGTDPGAARDLTVANLAVNDCDGDSGGTPPEPSLSASPSGSGRIVVAHLGYRAACCLGFDVTAREDPAAGAIDVTYTPSGEPCDCQCSYDLGYRLEGVDAGDWTLTAEGASTSVHLD